ncbi:MAG: hypothetical protein MK289_10570 [Trichodesmium sp. ALOHA_ZT_67]|nr:hypothetical protein [Trichodesmium sp. ALOHA_ZT_67]MDT9341295.1 hypothetical protein [Trichodesmium erythraeum 21-75]
MAYYTAILTIAVKIESLQPVFTEILNNCGCEIIYTQKYYLMAREFPGQVSFSQLVTIEITLYRVTNNSENIQLNIVTRNEELPLKSSNHCSQVFDLLTYLIVENSNWELLEIII